MVWSRLLQAVENVLHRGYLIKNMCFQAVYIIPIEGLERYDSWKQSGLLLTTGPLPQTLKPKHP